MTDELSAALTAVKSGSISFCKFITANDAGVTGAHQAGLYIPKNSVKLIFQTPGVKGQNKERFATLQWFDGTISQCSFKYYGSGSRNEYRITRLGKQLLEGQLVILVKMDEITYLGFILTDMAESFLEGLDLTADDANALIVLTEDPEVNVNLPHSNLESHSYENEDISVEGGVPPFEDMMVPVLEVLRNLNGQGTVDEIEEAVVALLQLTEDDIVDIHRGTRTKLSYRLAWARNYLKRFGLIANTERGVWQLTPKGYELHNIDKHEVIRAVKQIDIDSEDPDTDILEIDKNEDESFFDIENITSPFDPKDIRIIVEPKTIDHLVNRLRWDEIDMNTEFQRKGNLWKPDVQSRLVESILLRLPLPPFYFDADDEDKWLVVDGLQRLWTIKNFIVDAEKNDPANPPLQLTGLEILTDYSNKGITYEKLNRTMQRRILETPITTYLILPGTPRNVKYNVFRRINTGGLGLNSMEIRNALNQGSPSTFLEELSEDRDLRMVLKLQDKRMEDRELYLRAYSFINSSYLKYNKPLSGFLDKAMESLADKSDLELTALKSGIIDAVYFQIELFGKHIFSRSIIGDRQRVRLNSALFEVWVSEVYKLSKSERESVLFNRTLMIQEYKKMFLDEDFNRAVATSTSGPAAVRNRFENIQTLINKFKQ